jgi:tryptophanyl-tRNA synthetase
LLPATLDELAERPEARNLIAIYAALSDQSEAQTVTHFTGQQFSKLKTELADLAVEKLAPIATRMRELMSDQAELDRLLKRGTERAAAVANPILRGAQDLMGLVR